MVRQRRPAVVASLLLLTLVHTAAKLTTGAAAEGANDKIKELLSLARQAKKEKIDNESELAPARKGSDLTNSERINNYIQLLGKEGIVSKGASKTPVESTDSDASKGAKSPKTSPPHYKSKETDKSSGQGSSKGGNKKSSKPGSGKGGSSKAGSGFVPKSGSSKAGTPPSEKSSKESSESSKSKGSSKGKGFKIIDKTPSPTFFGSTSTPSPSPSPSPSPAFSTAPSPEFNPDCTPTVGPCISDEATLAATLVAAPAGSTVAICGGDIILDSQLNLPTDDVTLCCAGTVQFCSLFAGPNERVLAVTGESVTIQDLLFFQGSSDEPGGNLFIGASGDHRLIRSEFHGGQSTFSGGNVFITAPDGTVEVENTVFFQGIAALQGGGLAVEGASTVTIFQSFFDSNESGQGGGGGLSLSRGEDSLSGQEIIVESSEFSFNRGDLGGGLVFSSLGQSPSITVVNNFFNDNVVEQGGGAGVFGQFLEDITLVMEGNDGFGNQAGQTILCNDFLAIDGANQQPVCIDVDEDFTDP